MTTTPHPARFDRRRLAWMAVNALLLALVVCLIWNILGNPTCQWDLRMYRFTVKVWQAGLNPYDAATLSKAAGWKVDKSYIYPPDTLPFFAVFTWFDIPGIRLACIVFQGALFSSLVVCWNRYFLAPEDRFHPLFFVLCLLAFNHSLLVNLITGNMALLETALLWWGLAAWLRGRPVLFAVLLWLAATMRLMPMAFSVLLLLSPTRRWAVFFSAWAAMGVRLGLDWLGNATLFHQFTQALLGNFGGQGEGGVNNPCLTEVIKTLLLLADRTLDAQELKLAATPIYAVVVLVVLGTSWLAWRAICRRFPAGTADAAGRDPRGLRIVCLVCLAYALTAPRMKDYSYIFLLPVAWQVGKWFLSRHAQAWVVFVVLICLSDTSVVGLLSAAYHLLWKDLAYFTALALWVFLVREAFAAPDAFLSTEAPQAASP